MVEELRRLRYMHLLVMLLERSKTSEAATAACALMGKMVTDIDSALHVRRLQAIPLLLDLLGEPPSMVCMRMIPSPHVRSLPLFGVRAREPRPTRITRKSCLLSWGQVQPLPEPSTMSLAAEPSVLSVQPSTATLPMAHLSVHREGTSAVSTSAAAAKASTPLSALGSPHRRDSRAPSQPQQLPNPSPFGEHVKVLGSGYLHSIKGWTEAAGVLWFVAQTDEGRTDMTRLGATYRLCACIHKVMP